MTKWKDEPVNWDKRRTSVLLVTFVSGAKIVLLYPKGKIEEHDELLNYLGEKIASVETIDAYDFWNV